MSSMADQIDQFSPSTPALITIEHNRRHASSTACAINFDGTEDRTARILLLVRGLLDTAEVCLLLVPLSYSAIMGAGGMRKVRPSAGSCSIVALQCMTRSATAAIEHSLPVGEGVISRGSRFASRWGIA